MNATQNHDFAIGAEVVTFADGNYCRGRIIEKIERDESFKV